MSTFDILIWGNLFLDFPDVQEQVPILLRVHDHARCTCGAGGGDGARGEDFELKANTLYARDEELCGRPDDLLEETIERA